MTVDKYLLGLYMNAAGMLPTKLLDIDLLFGSHTASP